MPVLVPASLLDADDLAYLGEAPAGDRIGYGPEPLVGGVERMNDVLPGTYS